jgi:hypothetical protein
MSFIRGKDIKVFITTELSGGKVALTGSSPDAASGSFGIGLTGTSRGIGTLGAVTTSSNTADKVAFVEGVDVVKGWEDENGNFFGTQKEYHIPYRKKWEVTITSKTEDKAFSVLNNGARHGVTGSASGQLHSGLTEIMSTSGYRVYLFDGSKWDVFYHGLVPADGYTEALDPAKAHVQTIKFVGNEWSTNLADGAVSTGQAQE